MTAFGPMFVHPSVAFDLAKSGLDTTGITVVYVGTEIGTRLIHGECTRLVEARFMASAMDYVRWTPPEIQPDPKDPRRWFDPFRTPAAITHPPRQALAARMWRPRARADVLQRRRHKRKQFLEAIRA